MLPSSAEAVHLCDQLTQLLATAAGHPRRLEVLFRELGEFRASKSATALSAESSCDAQRRAAAECFVSELALWLSRPDYAQRTKSNLDCITAKVETTVRLPVDYSDLLSLTISEEQLYRLPYEVLNESIGYAIEALAMYSATRFRMPDSTSDTELLKEVLLGVPLGFCQLVNAGTSMHHFFAFIPLPVLDGVRPVQLLSRGEALVDLRDAIRAMYKSKRGEGDKAHKDLQEVAVTSILLMARCQYNFTLAQLCEPGNRDSLGVNLRGGPDVMLATVDRKTADETQGLTAAEVKSFVDQLKASKEPGVIIKVRSDGNVGFYGLFRTNTRGFTGFCVQCKDWFATTVDQSRPLESPRQPEIVLDDGATVTFASLLFTVNKPPPSVSLESFEGVISVASMRNWLPTAAHALQTVTHLREIFGWYEAPKDSENEKRWRWWLGRLW
jgi:hypothetical protein